jgi:outer membrane protein OmpA-like peptidoglycan-associated protein
MKKLLVVSLLFISLFSFSQKKGLSVHLGCYTHGDTLSVEAVKKTGGVNLFGEGSENYSLKQWNLSVTFKNNKSKIIKHNPKEPNLLSPQMKDLLLDKFKAITRVVIKDIVIGYYDKIDNKNSEMNLDSVVFYLDTKATKWCDEKTARAKDDLMLKFSCFKDGDIATVKDILHFPTFSIINFNPKVDVRIISFDFAVPKMDARRNPKNIDSIFNNGIELNAESFEMVKKLYPDEEFVLNNIRVEFSNRKTKTKEVSVLNPVRIKIGRKSTVPCGEAGSDTLFVLEYSGKLLTGKDRNQPLVGQKVFLKNAKDTIVQITVTNSYGDFTFRNLKADESYRISVLAEDNPKLKGQQLYLAKVDGTIVKSFERNGNSFVYSVLPAELFKLAKEDEEDTELRIRNFGKSDDKELTVIEDVYYAPNSYEINDLSIMQLDKIISAMKQNQALKLSISSHTDANGDDSYNMGLSEKRAKKVMEYLLLKGIAAERMKAKGYGETQIKNRCKNGVDCSELEHELNRRTEFKFTK